jgi:hypothetical protein
MSRLIIVGGGILGLSVAEYFSRRTCRFYQEVTLIDSESRYSGSQAAAANLSTKGQLFGRDPHFQTKLESKKIYQNWLMHLLLEIKDSTSLNFFYKEGVGIDYFAEIRGRDLHYMRVKQENQELITRNLSTDFIQKKDDTQIVYKNEAWVDALFLLDLLKKVLLFRGVLLVKDSFEKADYHFFLNKKINDTIVFCTGAWTKDILNKFSILLPDRIKNQERLTVGSTFFGKNIVKNFCDDFVIQEKISFDLKRKVTLSGDANKKYLSSSTLKIQSLNEAYNQDLDLKNKALLNLALDKYQGAPVLLKEKTDGQLFKKSGFRVGYSRREVLIEQLKTQGRNKVFVCAGAHKSGYLFAPRVGAMLQRLLFKD